MYISRGEVGVYDNNFIHIILLFAGFFLSGYHHLEESGTMAPESIQSELYDLHNQ